MKVLYIVPYVPSLVRVRPYQLIRHLSMLGHKVVLATIWTNEKERKELLPLQEICEEVIAVHLPPWKSLVNSLLALPTRLPLQYVYSWNSQLLELILRRIGRKDGSSDIDVIHVEHLRGAQYGVRLLQEKDKSTERPFPNVVWDSVDCISYLFRQASEKSAQGIKRRITNFDLKRTERFEGWLTTVFDQVLVTSQKDKDALTALSPDPAHPPAITVLSNGVDLDYFKDVGDQTREPATLVISGKMSYHANVSMVMFFVDEVMPSVWEKLPDVKLWIVGKDPPVEITRLAKNPNVTVTGTVDSIQPYLQSATIAVAPIQYGAGIQNKVLEAMAFSTPVIATSLATAALSVQSGKELVIADTPDEWVAAIESLIQSPDECKHIGAEGRRYVEQHHFWPDIVQRLVAIYGRAAYC